MRKLLLLTLFALWLLAGCTGYMTPDGGYGFDVQIRIAPPRDIPTVTPTIQQFPTATQTLSPTFTLTPLPTFMSIVESTPTEDPTPTQEGAPDDLLLTFLPLRYVVNTSGSWYAIRRSYDTKSERLAWLLPGEHLEYGNFEASRWLAVEYDGGTAYVFGECCTIEQ